MRRLPRLLEVRREKVRDAVLDAIRVIAMGAVERPLEDFVRLLLDPKCEFALAHGAGEDLHEVPVHGARIRTQRKKACAELAGMRGRTVAAPGLPEGRLSYPP